MTNNISYFKKVCHFSRVDISLKKVVIAGSHTGDVSYESHPVAAREDS